MKLEDLLWGPPHKRRDRTHHRKPLAIWKERMARMRHKAQFRRWRIKPITQAQYNEVFRTVSTGHLESFVGLSFVKTSSIA